MTETIHQQLARLEAQHDIRILYAVESGSRAWGFASPDSDWDVRFIYLHRPEWYLQIDEQKDSLGEMLPNDLDFAGWELRKTLRLFRKSNPPLLEWLRSPIVYQETSSVANTLRALTAQYFDPKSCLHHYLHMAEGNYREYLKGEEVRLKKYLYVLRPLLACDWIRRTNTMIPMEFDTLVEAEVHAPALRGAIEALLVRKKAGGELGTGPRIEILNAFIETQLAFYQDFVQHAEKGPTPDTERLNAVFRGALAEVWG